MRALIKIHRKFLIEQIQNDQTLKTTLKQAGHEQAINNLLSSTRYYNDILKIFSKIEKTNISEYSPGKIIFSQGDTPDNAYILLEGEVELLISSTKTKKIKSAILHKGALFGELGIIRNKLRFATAIAHKTSRLLVITGDDLKKYLLNHPQLKNLFSSLQSTYELPSHSIVEQYLGHLQGIGPAVTNIFRMEDGRVIVASKAVNENFFNLATTGLISEKLYHYKKGPLQIELSVNNNRLIGAKVLGVWDNLPIACQLILENKEISQKIIHNFENSADLSLAIEKPKPGESEIVCQCMSVSRDELQNLINKDVRDFDELSKITGACTVCKCCKFKILEMLGDKVWEHAVMRLSEKHNESIQSYTIKLTENQFKTTLPGQHIVLQIKIDDAWVERPYTISDQLQEQAARITIKKEPKGFFTNWLFEKAPNEFPVKVSQPQGEFVLDPDINKTALCFAGGIGITPFIAYAKALVEANNNKKLHIIYCVRSKNDFIFIDELNEIHNHNPSITVTYRSNDNLGIITGDEIATIIRSFNEPDIYICGSEGFEKLIHQAVENINYDQNKIHREQFVHAGSQ